MVVKHGGGQRTVEVKQWVVLRACKVDAALFLSLKVDGWWLLVESDAKPLQLVLNEPLVGDGLEAVEDDENQVAGAGGGDDLATTTLAVLGTWVRRDE